MWRDSFRLELTKPDIPSESSEQHLKTTGSQALPLTYRVDSLEGGLGEGALKCEHLSGGSEAGPDLAKANDQ